MKGTFILKYKLYLILIKLIKDKSIKIFFIIFDRLKILLFLKLTSIRNFKIIINTL